MTDESMYRYAVIGSLKQPTSAFYIAQWGRCGFIDGATLLRNTLRHEASLVPVSHYTNYRDALAVPSQNLKTRLEPIVASGAAALDRKAEDSLLPALQAIRTAIEVEPCSGGVEYDSAAGCAFRGRINFTFEQCP